MLTLRQSGVRFTKVKKIVKKVRNQCLFAHKKTNDIFIYLFIYLAQIKKNIQCQMTWKKSKIVASVNENDIFLMQNLNFLKSLFLLK